MGYVSKSHGFTGKCVNVFVCVGADGGVFQLEIPSGLCTTTTKSRKFLQF